MVAQTQRSQIRQAAIARAQDDMTPLVKQMLNGDWSDLGEDGPWPCGSATSFLTQKKAQMDTLCGEVRPDQKNNSVQKDEEKVLGGEG
jgi:hypothetical protein